MNLEALSRNIGRVPLSEDIVSAETLAFHKNWPDQERCFDNGWDYHLNYLAVVNQTLKYLHLSSENLAMFEFGACHDRIPGTPPYSSALCRYVLLHGVPTKKYFAYEPHYSEKHLDAQVNRCLPEGYYISIRKFISELPALAKLIKCANMSDYETVRSNVFKTINDGETPLISSMNVLNFPPENDKGEFWHLPGLHIHSGSAEEMKGFGQGGYKNNMKEWKNGFKEHYKLGDINFKTFFYSNDEIFLIWVNTQEK